MGMETIGKILKQTREEKGISLQEISHKTKVSLSYLKAIEAEDWEALPPKPYVKGFLRLYASSLGLDPEQFIAYYEQNLASSEPRCSPSDKIKNLKKQKEVLLRKKRLWIAGIVFLLAIVFLIFLLRKSNYTPTQTGNVETKVRVNKIRSPLSEKGKTSVLSSTPSTTSTASTPSPPTSPLQTSVQNDELSNKITIFPNSPSHKELRLSRILICSGVKNREPFDIRQKFRFVRPFSVCCFTEIRNASPPVKISHVWLHNNQPVDIIVLEVKAPHWRTWSRKIIRAKGNWKVVVYGPKGKKLGETSFVVE